MYIVYPPKGGGRGAKKRARKRRKSERRRLIALPDAERRQRRRNSVLAEQLPGRRRLDEKEDEDENEDGDINETFGKNMIFIIEVHYGEKANFGIEVTETEDENEETFGINGEEIVETRACAHIQAISYPLPT